HGYINESGKALAHIQESLKLARRIHYYKLIGMNLMMRLIFRNETVGRKDPDLGMAIRYFQKSRNELRLADYLLKLYEAHPGLLSDKEHSRRLAKMEKIYRQIRNRRKHRIVRQLARAQAPKAMATEPLYEWWHNLLEALSGSEKLEERLKKV